MTRSRVVAVACTAVVVTTIATPVATATSAFPTAAAATAPVAGLAPDVIVIMTDDQRAGTQRAMPYTWDFFTRARGVDYPNAQVPTNLCCPSRTAFLTGRYPTATGAWDNAGEFGGNKAIGRFENQSMLVALKQRNYHSGLFGKYVNGYGSPGKTFTAVPPGWDRFSVYNGPGGSGYFSNIRNLGGGYSTDVLGRGVTHFLRDAPTDQPLFAYYAPYAPHSPYKAGPYKGAGNPRLYELARKSGEFGNESFNQVKPGQPQWLKSLPTRKRTAWNKVIRKQTDTLLGVDVNVKRIVNAVAKYRNVDNTLFVFMSDNGYGWGDHRQLSKRSPYVTTNEIPLMVRYPAGAAIPTPRVDYRLANNVDVTATILATAGALNISDGITLNGPERHGFIPLMSAPTIGRKATTPSRPAYCGVRNHQWSYLEYGTGEVELYNLQRDRYQMDNLAGAMSVWQKQAQLQQLTRSRFRCDVNQLQNVIGPHLPTADE